MRISDWSSDVCSSDLRYHLVAQPVAAKPLLPAGRGRSIAVRRLDPRDPLLLALPLEETVLAYRAAQGALCFGAFKQDEIIGCLWLCLSGYEEDEVRSCYRLAPAGTASWAFDVYLAPAPARESTRLNSSPSCATR